LKIGQLMAILDPLKYCFQGQHCMPRAGFRLLPGLKAKRAVCAECYAKIMADRMHKKRRGRVGSVSHILGHTLAILSTVCARPPAVRPCGPRQPPCQRSLKTA